MSSRPGAITLGELSRPGLEAMTSFLYDRTALLPKLTLA